MTEETGYAAPPPLTAPPVRPPLRRSESDKVLAGVAGGFARWLAIDPVIVRVVLVVLAVFGGSGLLLYAIGWLFIPAESKRTSEAEAFLRDRGGRHSVARVAFVVALVLIGLILAMSLLSAATAFGPMGHWGGGGALLLIAAAAALVIYLVRRPNVDRTAEPLAWTPPQPAGSDAAAPSAGSPTAPFAYGGSGEYPGFIPVPAPIALPPKPRSYLGLATLSLAVIVAGVLGAISAGGSANIPAVVVAASALGIVGVGLVVGSAYGRARWLIACAVPLLFVSAVAAAVPHDLGHRLNSGMGTRSWTPTSPADLLSNYQVGAGSATVDLSGLKAPAGFDRSVAVTVGVGQVRVLVPSGMRVFIDAHVDTGRISVRDLVLATVPSVPQYDASGNLIAVPQQTGYFDSPVLDKSGRNVVAQIALPDNPTTGPTITLVLNASFGSVEVNRAPASN